MAKETATNTAPAAKADPVFSKEDLIASAAVFKTIPAIMTGALYTVKKDALTRDEAATALKKFLEKPVKGDK